MVEESIDLATELEFQSIELSYSLSTMSNAQWGFIVFSIMIFGAIILIMGKKSKGRTETFSETLRHDKKPIIGLFVVLPIFIIGYAWSFLYIFHFI